MTHTLPDRAPWYSPTVDRSQPIGLVLRTKVAREIAQTALQAAPQEMCGVLVAHAGDGRVRFVPIANVARVPEHRFTFSAGEFALLLTFIQQSGEELLGIVHSHPKGPAEPSTADIDNAMASPGALPLHYLIMELSHEGGQYRSQSLTSWRIQDGQATREQVLFV